MKKSHVVIGLFFSVVAVFAILQITGKIDLSKKTEQSSEIAEAEIVDSWTSPAFGNAEAQITVNLYSDNAISITTTAKQKNCIIYNKEFFVHYGPTYANDISHEDVELSVMAKLPEIGENYCGLLVPYDCTKVILNCKENNVYDFELHNKNYCYKGKISLLTYPENNDNELVLVDKKGNEHIINEE